MNAIFARLWVWVRRAATENLGLKVVSLGTALLLFSYVRGSEDAQRFVFVDVVTTHPASDADFVLMSDVPDRVRLTLRGSRALLNSLKREDLDAAEIQIDSSRRNYYFDPKDFVLPAGVSVEQITPASFPLAWTPRVRRTLPIHVRLRGKLEDGLAKLGTPSIEPATVTLEGPAAELDTLPSVATEEIDLSRFSSGKHTLRVSLAQPPQHVVYDWEGPVTLHMDVGFENIERRFTGLPIAVVGNGVTADLRPKRAQVVLSGPPRIVSALDPESVVPWLDLSDPALVGTMAMELKVRGVPRELQVVRIEPAEVFVTIKSRRAVPASKPRLGR